MIEIYVNYDCDLSAANVFERLVDDLSKLAMGREGYELGGNALQVQRMRVKSLECLCSILKCMVEWSREVYVNPHVRTMIKEEEAKSLERDSLKDDPTTFEKVKQHKHVIERGLKLFSQVSNKTEGGMCGWMIG